MEDVKIMKPDLIIENHCVDDHSSTIELAIEQFRSSFPYCKRVNVWPEGNGITYEFRNTSSIKVIAEEAKLIISHQHLPLELKCLKNYRGDHFLMVEFKSKN